jgi:hypothetical protein
VVPVLVPVVCVGLLPVPVPDPVLERPLAPPEVADELDLGWPVVPDRLPAGADGERPVVLFAVEPPWVDLVCPGVFGPTGWWTVDGDVSAKARPATRAATATITSVRRVFRRHLEGPGRCAPASWESLTTAAASAARIRPFIS